MLGLKTWRGTEWALALSALVAAMALVVGPSCLSGLLAVLQLVVATTSLVVLTNVYKQLTETDTSPPPKAHPTMQPGSNHAPNGDHSPSSLGQCTPSNALKLHNSMFSRQWSSQAHRRSFADAHLQTQQQPHSQTSLKTGMLSVPQPSTPMPGMVPDSPYLTFPPATNLPTDAWGMLDSTGVLPHVNGTSVPRATQGTQTDGAQRNKVARRNTAQSIVELDDSLHWCKNLSKDAAWRGSIEGLQAKPSFSDLPQNGGKIQVLSVDDEPISHMVMKALLNTAQYEIITLDTGEQLLAYIEEVAVLPDVILLDVTLPGITGFEATCKLREDWGAAQLPIIMVTCSSQESDVIEGLSAGANDYMTKPLRYAELKARIGTQVALRKNMRLATEASRNLHLLRSILPPYVIAQLKRGVQLVADFHESVTILFSDIKSFTRLAAEWPTEQIILMLNEMFTAFDNLCEEYGVYKVETIGDAYMIVSGHDGVRDHAARMCKIAAAMIQTVSAMRGCDGRPIEIRIGMHTGPAHSGVVGVIRPRYCFFGDTVNTASRMESTSYPMAVQVSEATYSEVIRWQESCRSSDMLDKKEEESAEHEFVPCGRRSVKGKGMMNTYLLKSGAWEAGVKIVKMEQDNHRESIDEQHDHDLLTKNSWHFSELLCSSQAIHSNHGGRDSTTPSGDDARGDRAAQGSNGLIKLANHGTTGYSDNRALRHSVDTMRPSLMAEDAVRTLDGALQAHCKIEHIDEGATAATQHSAQLHSATDSEPRRAELVSDLSTLRFAPGQSLQRQRSRTMQRHMTFDDSASANHPGITLRSPGTTGTTATSAGALRPKTRVRTSVDLVRSTWTCGTRSDEDRVELQLLDLCNELTNYTESKAVNSPTASSNGSAPVHNKELPVQRNS